MRELKLWLAAVLALMAAFLSVPVANAHQNPEGCAGSGLSVNFSSDSGFNSILRVGDHLEIGATVSNNRIDNPCDIGNLDVSVVLPATDGSPGQTVVLGSGLSVPSGTAPFRLQFTAPYDVNLDEGVFEAPVTISFNAVLHSGPEDQEIPQGSRHSEIRISRPRAELTVTPSVTSGSAPLDVTYTYKLTNSSPPLPAPMLPSPSISSITSDSDNLVTDANCAPVQYVSGNLDLTTPAFLDPFIAATTAGSTDVPAETWTFTCSKTLEVPGLYSSSASVVGNSSRDGRAWPDTLAGTEVTAFGSDLILDKSHEGDLLAGGTGQYRLKVTNAGNQASSGSVKVSDQMPAGLAGTAISGDGWSCDLASLSCQRSDPLGSGSTYPDVIITVKVDGNPSKDVINSATVSGGGEVPGAAANNGDSDPTTIRIPGQPSALPSNRFKIEWIKTKKNGTAAIRVKVPGRGKFRADDADSRKDQIQRISRLLPRSRSFTFFAKPRQQLLATLRKSGKVVVVAARITFIPTGGLSASKTVKLKLRVR